MEQTSEKEQREDLVDDIHTETKEIEETQNWDERSHSLIEMISMAIILVVASLIVVVTIQEQEDSEQAALNDIAISRVIAQEPDHRFIEDHLPQLRSRTDMDVTAAKRLSGKRFGRIFNGIVCAETGRGLLILRLTYEDEGFRYPEITHADDYLLEQITGICTKALGQNPA